MKRGARGGNLSLFHDFSKALQVEQSRNPRPLMLVIAGHNGAGKSTCYREFLADSVGAFIENHIDPDTVERDIRAELTAVGIKKSDLEYSKLAQRESNSLRQQYFDNRRAFSFETVLSDPVGGKVGFMREAVQNGYLVVLLAVGLDSPDKSVERVALRVRRGGHSVPTEKIYERYPRVIGNIKQAVTVATLALVVDNSSDNLDCNNGAYFPFVLYVHGEIIKAEDDVPAWWMN